MIYRPPKIFIPIKGISSDAVFLKGPKDWSDVFGKKLNKIKGIYVLLGKEGLTGWDFDGIIKADVVVICFRGIDEDNSALLNANRWSQFDTPVYCYIDGRSVRNREIIDKICELNQVKVFDRLEEMEKQVILDFQYLEKNNV